MTSRGTSLFDSLFALVNFINHSAEMSVAAISLLEGLFGFDTTFRTLTCGDAGRGVREFDIELDRFSFRPARAHDTFENANQAFALDSLKLAKKFVRVASPNPL